MALIDPLKAFPNGFPKMEETSIFASLSIKGRGRSIIEDNTIISSEKDVKVNFLGFDEKTQSFTTNWSELTGPHTAGNEPEGFGMTSISIEVNPSFVPKVIITFIDIRGAALFNFGASSKYAVLFQFPPPEYTLIIKGYFGRALTYGLHMIKQNSRFNSKTGNFEITADFIAITFAPLADIPVAFIKMAPFMANEGKTADPRADKVDTFYELIGASQVLNENIEELKQGGDFREFEELGDEISELDEDIKTLSNFDFLNGQHYKSNVFNDGKVNIIKVNGFEIETDKKGSFSKERFKNFKDFKETSNRVIIEAQEKVLELIKNPLSDESKNIINEKNVGVLNKIGEGKHFNLDITGTTPNLILILKDIPEKINEIRKKKEKKERERKELCSKLTSEITKQEKAALGFRPTIYNIFKILCDDADTFIRLLKETSKRAQEDTTIKSHIETRAPDAKVSDETKQNKISRYAWPEVIKTEGNKKIRIYPGDNNNFINMPEVEFVERFINASIEVATGEAIQRKLDSTDDEGAREWTPLGPFEEVRLGTKSDYGINQTNIDKIIETLIKRAQIIINWNLRHENEIDVAPLGILEGQNILHEIVDKNILLTLKNTSITAVKSLDLFKNNILTINFTHSGELDGNFRTYKYQSETDIKSAFKIEENFIPETTETLQSGIKNIREAAEKQGFIGWLSSLFGNDIGIEITDENKIIYKDKRENESKSNWFKDGDNISIFSYPPLEKFNNIKFKDDPNKVQTYSDNILKPIFQDAENFLYDLTSFSHQAIRDPSVFREGLIGNKTLELQKGRRHIKIKLLNEFVNERTNFFPGIIEVPYLLLVIWGWIISSINGNTNIKINEFKVKSIGTPFNMLDEEINYFTNLPKIVKDQLINEYDKFKNDQTDENGNPILNTSIFSQISSKILKNPNANILELNDNQFQQDINNIDNWGEPESENDWWKDLMKRKFIFLGFPLVIKKPEDVGNTLFNLNPSFRSDAVEKLIEETLKFLNKNINDKIDEIEKIEKDIKSQFRDSNIKLDVYNRFKTINDRWLSGGFSPFDSNKGNEKLISKFNFVDRAMKDVGVIPKLNGKEDFSRQNELSDGESMIINFSPVESVIDNSDMSLYTLIDLILTKNKFQFFPLQNFMKFDSGNWNENNQNIRNLFGFNPPGEMVSSPIFTCLYIDSTSKFLDNNPGEDIFQNDVADIERDIIGSSNKDDEKNDRVNAFRVKFGDPNQSMFKDINLDQAEFKETIESIKILDQISQQGAEDVDAKTILKGQNLFNTYEQRSYSCEVEMLGNAMIQPTQYFQLENVPLFFGAYMIIQVNHNIIPNQMTTKFKGVRIPKNSLPLVTDYATAVGFNLCTDSSVEGSNRSKTTSLGSIDIDKINNSDGLYIESGNLYYVIDPQKGVAGKILINFMNALQKHLGNIATLGSNGIMRNLEAVVAGGSSRSKTSKHGAGLAIDLLISTSNVNYKELGWPLTNKELVKNIKLMIEIDKFVLTDPVYKNLIKWGGHFKSNNPNNLKRVTFGTRSFEVRIDELHHFEIKDGKIEQFFNDSNKTKMKKLGIKVPNKQSDLVTLYSFPFEGTKTSKEKVNQQIADSGTGEDDGVGDGVDYNKT